MANVYLARASGPGGFARHVVIKALTTTRSEDETYISMFLDEARLAAMLHHQHIAQVFEVGCADDGRYYLAMEYVHGMTVRRVLEKSRKRKMRLPLDFGLSVACASAAGLHHAHECCDLDGRPLGIVHRDVSLSNVLVGYDGSIKLIDFGIAKANQRQAHTAVGRIKGKTGYMSPEQARGFAVDRRSDVFALGVLTYELTTQTRAFHGSSDFETMEKTLRGEVRPPTQVVPGFPRELEDVILTALEVDPDDRFQDAEAMRQALDQVARELSLVVGAKPVIAALETLFERPSDPWILDEPELSEPRIARGTDRVLPNPPPPAAPAAIDRITAPIPRPVAVLPPAPVSSMGRAVKMLAAAMVLGMGFGGGALVLQSTRSDSTAAELPPPPPAPAAPIMPVGPVGPSGSHVAPAPVAEPPLPPPTPTIQLEVTTDPPGATVVLDGTRLGTTPYSVAMPPKSAKGWLKVRMHGRIAVKTQVDLGQDVHWNVRLEPLAR
jgi:serine/threonine-protein kinase